MRKRRDSNLTLSREMLRLADSYFKQKCYEIDDAYRMKFFSMKQEVMLTRNYFLVDKLYIEWAKEKVKARIETYIDAFKRANLIPGDGDINEIKWDLEDIILNVGPGISIETQAILEREKMRLIEAGCHNLEIFIQEQELERKNAETLKPESPSAVHYITNIHGDNKGNIAQGGSGNTQSSNRSDDET
jgi:hypothetical protein